MVCMAIISNDSVDSSIFNRSQERDKKSARSTGGFFWNTTNYTRYINWRWYILILTFLACIEFCVQFPFPSTWSGTPKNYFFEMSPLHVHRFALMYTWFMKRQKEKFPGENHMVWIGKTKHTSSLTSSQYRKDFNYCRCKFDHLWVWLLATAPLSYVTCLIISQMNRNAILMLSYIQAKWTVAENVHRSYWIIRTIHKTFHQSQFLSQLGLKLHPL